jgi:hypothetical protein
MTMFALPQPPDPDLGKVLDALPFGNQICQPRDRSPGSLYRYYPLSLVRPALALL